MRRPSRSPDTSSAQVVHIDLIEGAAWVPWILIAVHRLTEVPITSGAGDPDPVRRAARGRRRAVALFAVASGLTALSGGVEAALDGSVMVAIYWIWRLAASGRVRRPLRRSLSHAVVPVVVGVAGGVLLGAAQWLPGVAFQGQSQRSVTSYDFFSTGSLPWRLVSLLASPFLLGTNQDQPGYYVGPYNFPRSPATWASWR